jgi:DNA sulfur modification protein DndE
MFDQHYAKELSENDFIKLYKLHLRDGLDLWINELEKGDITKGDHISFLLKPIKNGLTLRSNSVIINSGNVHINSMKEITSLLSFELGKTESGETIEIRINAAENLIKDLLPVLDDFERMVYLMFCSLIMLIASKED